MLGFVRSRGHQIFCKSGFKIVRFTPHLKRENGNNFLFGSRRFETEQPNFSFQFDVKNIQTETMTSLTITDFEVVNTKHDVGAANVSHFDRFKNKYGEHFSSQDVDLDQFSDMDVIDLFNITKIESTSVNLDEVSVFDIGQNSATKIQVGPKEVSVPFGSGYAYLAVPNYYHRIQRDNDTTRLLVKSGKEDKNILFLKFNAQTKIPV